MAPGAVGPSLGQERSIRGVRGPMLQRLGHIFRIWTERMRRPDVLHAAGPALHGDVGRTELDVANRGRACRTHIPLTAFAIEVGERLAVRDELLQEGRRFPPYSVNAMELLHGSENPIEP